MPAAAGARGAHVPHGPMIEPLSVAAGLAFAAVGDGGNGFFDRVYKKFGTRSGTNVAPSIDANGHGWTWADVTTTLSTPSGGPGMLPGGASNAPLSVFVVAKVATISGGAFPTLLSIDDGNTSNVYEMFLRHTTNIAFVRMASTGGPGTSTWQTNGAAAVPGSIQTFGMSWNLTEYGSNNPTPIVYVDGASVALTQAVAPTSAEWATPPGGSRRVWLGSRVAATNSMQGTIYAAFAWNRVLSAQEMSWLNANWPALFGGDSSAGVGGLVGGGGEGGGGD